MNSLDARENINNRIPKVAVCLAAYNGARWLEEQVNTILKQRDVAVKVFISVDKSSDQTEAWVDRKKSLDSRVCSLPHGHRFGGPQRIFFV